MNPCENSTTDSANEGIIGGGRNSNLLVDLFTALGLISALSVIIPGLVLLAFLGGVRAAPLRNLTMILASFAILHGFYHLSLLAKLTDVAFILDFSTSVILVLLGVYYSERIAGTALSILVLSDITDALRNLVPVMLVIALILFLRLSIRSRSLSSLQTQFSVFLSIWIIAELLRALLVFGAIAVTPALQLLAFEVHTMAMVAFGFFLLFRFYRVTSRSGAPQLESSTTE